MSNEPQKNKKKTIGKWSDIGNVVHDIAIANLIVLIIIGMVIVHSFWSSDEYFKAFLAFIASAVIAGVTSSFLLGFASIITDCHAIRYSLEKMNKDSSNTESLPKDNGNTDEQNASINM